jgi:hypothetical protein
MKKVIYGLCIAFAAGHVTAATVFNAFGPGDSINPFSGTGVAWNQNVEYGIGGAAAFSVVGGPYVLDAVVLSMDYLQESGKMNVSIVEDNNGAPTGPRIELVTSDISAVSNFLQIVTFESSLHPVLAEGKNFWLVIDPPAQNVSNQNDDAVFNWNSGLVFGRRGYREFDFNRGIWLPWDVSEGGLLPAFRIEGTLVPEPGAMALLAVGAAALGFRARWRRE